MAEFKIRIIETLEKVVTVSAADRKNALEIAEIFKGRRWLCSFCR